MQGVFRPSNGILINGTKVQFRAVLVTLVISSGERAFVLWKSTLQESEKRKFHGSLSNYIEVWHSFLEPPQVYVDGGFVRSNAVWNVDSVAGVEFTVENSFADLEMRWHSPFEGLQPTNGRVRVMALPREWTRDAVVRIDARGAAVAVDVWNLKGAIVHRMGSAAAVPATFSTSEDLVVAVSPRWSRVSPIAAALALFFGLLISLHLNFNLFFEVRNAVRLLHIFFTIVNR